MKKIFLLIISIFILTGCSAEYNLVYENNLFNESLKIITLKDEYFDGSLTTSLIDNYYSMPLLTNYKLQPGDNPTEDCEECKFYNKELIDENNNYGINMYYNYEEKSEFSNSSIIYTLFEKNYINDNYIEVRDCKNIFNYYTNLNEIKIVFSTDKEVVESNSDQEIDGKYYWYINKENYKDKEILIKLGESEKEIVRSDGYLSGNIIKYVLMGLAIIILISIIVIYEKVKNSNKE